MMASGKYAMILALFSVTLAIAHAESPKPSNRPPSPPNKNDDNDDDYNGTGERSSLISSLKALVAYIMDLTSNIKPSLQNLLAKLQGRLNSVGGKGAGHPGSYHPKSQTTSDTDPASSTKKSSSG